MKSLGDEAQIPQSLEVKGRCDLRKQIKVAALAEVTTPGKVVRDEEFKILSKVLSDVKALL